MKRRVERTVAISEPSHRRNSLVEGSGKISSSEIGVGEDEFSDSWTGLEVKEESSMRSRHVLKHPLHKRRVGCLVSLLLGRRVVDSKEDIQRVNDARLPSTRSAHTPPLSLPVLSNSLEQPTQPSRTLRVRSFEPRSNQPIELCRIAAAALHPSHDLRQLVDSSAQASKVARNPPQRQRVSYESFIESGSHDPQSLDSVDFDEGGDEVELSFRFESGEGVVNFRRTVGEDVEGEVRVGWGDVPEDGGCVGEDGRETQEVGDLEEGFRERRGDGERRGGRGVRVNVEVEEEGEGYG